MDIKITEDGVTALNQLKEKLTLLRKMSGFGTESLDITSDQLGILFTELEDTVINIKHEIIENN